MSQSSSIQRNQRRVAQYWVINQFLRSLKTRFGSRVTSIARIDIGSPHWSFHKDITLIDLPGWENEQEARLQAVLPSVDGLILVDARSAASEEVKVLLKNRAFNESKQCADISAEGLSAWKAPFLLSVYRTKDNAIRPSQLTQSYLRKEFGQRMKDLSENPEVLPHISRWDDRAEHFSEIVKHYSTCPHPTDRDDQSIHISIHELVSATLAERYWAALNLLVTFSLFVFRTGYRGSDVHIKANNNDAITSNLFDTVVAKNLSILENKKPKLMQKSKDKLIEEIDNTKWEDIFQPARASGKREANVATITERVSSIRFRLDNCVASAHRSYCRAIVENFVQNVCKEFVEKDFSSWFGVPVNESDTQTKIKQLCDDLRYEETVDGQFKEASRQARGIDQPGIQAQPHQTHKITDWILNRSLIRETETKIASIRSHQDSIIQQKLFKEQLMKELGTEMERCIGQWSVCFQACVSTCLGAIRSLIQPEDAVLPASNAQSSSNSRTLTPTSENVKSLCKKLKQQVHSYLNQHAEYVKHLESYVDLSLDGDEINMRGDISTGRDTIASALIPRGQDLYDAIDKLTDKSYGLSTNVHDGQAGRAAATITKPDTSQSSHSPRYPSNDAFKVELKMIINECMVMQSSVHPNPKTIGLITAKYAGRK